MSPEGGQRWYQFLLPIVERGGPVLSLLLAFLLAGSLYFGLGLLRECVDRNRILGERLVTQQERFHGEIMLHLSRCAQAPR